MRGSNEGSSKTVRCTSTGDRQAIHSTLCEAPQACFAHNLNGIIDLTEENWTVQYGMTNSLGGGMMLIHHVEIDAAGHLVGRKVHHDSGVVEATG